MLWLNPLAPPVPNTLDEALLLVLQSLLWTIFIWYVGAVVVSWTKGFRQRDNVWTTRSLVTWSYTQSALLTAGIWSCTIGYVVFEGAPGREWAALVPLWVGVGVSLFIAAWLLFKLRGRVTKGKRAVE